MNFILILHYRSKYKDGETIRQAALGQVFLGNTGPL
jgi:hypothetical protein